jgi:uncharacterized protein (DUF302 family)
MSAMLCDGLIEIESKHTVKETIDRLETNLKAKGVTVFARIDHQAAAVAVGLPLRPTEVLVFGDPRAGTALMQSVQAAAIDLPLKMLARQDEAGKVWLAYNDMQWLARRHHLPPAIMPAVEAMAQGLATLAAATAS